MVDVKGQLDGTEWGGCNPVYSMCAFLAVIHTYVHMYISQLGSPSQLHRGIQHPLQTSVN